ncbi:hypothetical protein [Cellulomonas sp. ATA003]|nr:hypothetical protein [Cellulomonas sp. ATA003]WNB85240.1 hypothetical protein REH70_16640 [Cellulomonas sp. ATA003]
MLPAAAVRSEAIGAVSWVATARSGSMLGIGADGAAVGAPPGTGAGATDG